MLLTCDIFKDKPYPDFIKEHSVWKKLSCVRKVFPLVNLPNFEETAKINNETEILHTVYNVIADIRYYIGYAHGPFQKPHPILLTDVLNQLKQLIDSDVIYPLTFACPFISKKSNGTINLILPEDIIHKNNVVLRKGTSLFKVYGQLIKFGYNSLPSLDTFNSFKIFSTSNISTQNCSVKFAADGADGIWDIATMSMRGITSCQSWSKGDGNSIKIIGSMIDPFTAIIYITNGVMYDAYGTRMLRRCVVRYVINQDTKQPYLLLEKMYPSLDKNVLNIFQNSLSKRTNIPIKYSETLGTKAYYGNQLYRSYIPLSDELKKIDSMHYPYRDTNIAIKSDPDCKFAMNIFDRQNKFKATVSSLINNAIKSRLFTRDRLSKYGKQAYIIVQCLKGTKPCTCKTKKCKKNHDAIDLGEVININKLFVTFVCEQSKEQDPFEYMRKNLDKCKEFIKNKFNDVTSPSLATFMSTNIINYIESQI